MTDKTLRDLTVGSAVSGSDIFISRQGADTADKSVTATQISTYVNTVIPRATPKLATTRWLVPQSFAGTATTTMTLNRIYLTPVFVPRATTFTDFGFVTVAVTAASYKVGVYADNGSGIPTGTPVSGTTGTVSSVTTASATAQGITFGTPVALQAGLYWLAAVTDVSGTLTSVSNTGQTNVFGATAIDGANGALLYVSGTYASGLVDLTGASLTYASGTGSFWYGLKAQ